MNSISIRELNEFGKAVDILPFQSAYNAICYDLNQAIGEIKQRNPNIQGYNIFVANEAFSGNEFFGSSIDLFVVFDAIQIELNQKKIKQNKAKRAFISFFKAFRDNFKIFRNKKKAAQKDLENTQKLAQKIEIYNADILKKDIALNLSKQLIKSTNIYIHKNKLSISGDEEFGVLINIYIVFENEGKYNLYSENSSMPIEIEFKNRDTNFINKNDRTYGQFAFQVRMFNNLFWNILNVRPNQIFIESLLYSCPDKLFFDEELNVTLKLINYIKNSPIKNLQSINDTNTNLFADKLNTVSYEMAIRFIKNLVIEK